MEGNPVSYLDPFGLEKVDTSGMHLVAAVTGSIAFGIGLASTGGTLGAVAAVVGAASSGFDAGLYINDVIESDNTDEAIEASSNALLAITGVGLGAATQATKLAAYQSIFSEMDTFVGAYSTNDTVNNLLELIKNAIKKKVKEYWEKKKNEH